jgi:predicted nucleic acid-binding protein
MEKAEVIFDTNIVIYLLDQEDFVAQRITNQFKNMRLGISYVTYIETLIGEDKFRRPFVQSILESLFLILPLEKSISLKTIELLELRGKKSLRNPKLPDIVIAATALVNDIPLFTNNASDFNFIKELEVIEL